MAAYNSVNFIRERIRLQETVVIADRRLVIISFVVLTLFLIASGVFIGYRLTQKRQLTTLEEGIQTQQSRKASFAQVQKLFTQRQAILARIKAIIEKRGKSWEAIDYLYALLPQNASIQSINLSSSGGGLLEFGVNTPDIFSFRELSTLLQSEEVRSSGYTPKLGSLSRGPKGEYSLQVELFLDAEASAEATASAQTVGASAL